MRRLISIIVVSSLFLAIMFTQRPNIGDVEASPDVHQGDIVLTDNDVYIIENQRLDINGSIIVEENATLILRNAIVNFTQTENYQLRMRFQNPANGCPRLQVDNASVTGGNYYLMIQLFDNSTANLCNLNTSWGAIIEAWDSNFVYMSNSTMFVLKVYHSSIANVSSSTLDSLVGLHSSTVRVSNCTVDFLSAEYSSSVDIMNSTIQTLRIRSRSVNCSVLELEPGFFSFWNYSLECSLAIAEDGWAPTVTLKNDTIDNWYFWLEGSSNATISNSAMDDLWVLYSSKVTAVDSTIRSLHTFHNSVVRLINSTGAKYVRDESRVYVSWYLDLHVVDSFGQHVDSATVTATYENGTMAESGLTDLHGWVRLTLLETMINATGKYPVGTYTAEAAFETYSNSTAVDMAGNQIVTLILSELPTAPPWDITGPTMWVPDGKCDMRDVALVAKLFGSIEGDGKYDVRADITGPTYLVADGKIDMRDVALVVKHFGEVYL